MDENNQTEKKAVKDIFNKETGKLMFTTFPDALRIDIQYKLAKDATDTTAEFTLEGIVNYEGNTRTYAMPDDGYILEKLQSLPPAERRLAFEYQIVMTPDGKAGYGEWSLDDGKVRLFRNHPGVEQIFSEIGMLEAAK
ncbi:hypothetical protein R84B8_01883 [Treponema sp. R8-4-B8]